MKKLNWLGNLIFIAIIAGNLTGCTAVRLMEISAGIGVNKTETGTEKQKSEKVVKKDVTLNFTPIGDGFGLLLEYKPHYEVQSRKIVKYESKGGIFSTLIGVAELGILAYSGYQWVEKVRDLSGDGSIGGSHITDGWSKLTWEKAVIIGVPLDYLLWSIVPKNFSPTKRTSWEPTGDTELGKQVGIPNHPITISLPQLGYTETHQTDFEGKLTILTRDLIGKIPGPELGNILREDSITIDAATNFDGERQRESFALRRSNALFRALYQEAYKRQ